MLISTDYLSTQRRRVMKRGMESLCDYRMRNHAGGVYTQRDNRRCQRERESLMRTTVTVAVVALVILLSGVFTSVRAQQPQIPTLAVCNPTQAVGKALVKIARRSSPIPPHAGTFTVRIELKCDPKGTGYPAGTLAIDVDMSDSIVQGIITGVTFEQVTSTGRHTPTVYLNGRCKVANVPGCRFWLMIADNKRAKEKETPDVIGFLVFNGAGQRIAYGTGPVVQGDITVAPTSF
jgi:hypothetical protein